MKIIITLFSVFLLTGCINNENTAKEDKIELKSFTDSLSYAFGSDIYKQISSNFTEIDFKILQAGLKNRSENANILIDSIKCQKIIEVFMMQKQQEMMQKQQKEDENTSYEEVLKKGEEFLAENGKKDGVITTKSGLQYIVMKEGKGKQPTATSNVTVHYHGTTPEGIVFDSSVDRGEPATFGLNQVIKGWTEGVALMKEGAKYKFFIPQELAYGANPRPGGPIKPYMPLIFEVELIKVN